jgi:hypothetical protein
MIYLPGRVESCRKAPMNHVPVGVGPRVLSRGEHVLDAIFARTSAILDA